MAQNLGSADICDWNGSMLKGLEHPSFHCHAGVAGEWVGCRNGYRYAISYLPLKSRTRLHLDMSIKVREP